VKRILKKPRGRGREPSEPKKVKGKGEVEGKMGGGAKQYCTEKLSKGACHEEKWYVAGGGRRGL